MLPALVIVMKFYHEEMEFEVPENVYYPREDSKLLAKTIEKMDIKGANVLEIGCGCGFLSILMAKRGASVTAVDINKDAVEITKANTETNKTAINAFESDLFSAIRGRFDLIIFNPPYLPTDEGENDKTCAGGKSGREVIEKFATEVKNYLKPHGLVLLVISSLTGEKEVLELFKKQNMSASVVAREKIPWEELTVIRAEQA